MIRKKTDAFSVANEIENIRDSIKRKHRAITHGETESDAALQKHFKPIVDPLLQLKDVLNKSKNDGKEEQEEIKYEQALPEKEEEDEPFKFPKKHQSLRSKHVKKYKDLALLGSEKLDTTFGIKIIDDKWYIGKSNVEFFPHHILVDEIPYPGTDGLYQLLFLHEPSNYTKSDLEVYKKILEQSGAHKTDRGRVRASRSKKYINIISKLFPPVRTTSSDSDVLPSPSPKKHSGKGFKLTVNRTSRPDYVYWDDPNELCDRLRLLISSRRAGHSGHNNEIISIIEELREKGYIEGGRNLIDF